MKDDKENITEELWGKYRIKGQRPNGKTFFYITKPVLIKIIAEIISSPVEPEVSPDFYEPYFGWCDVEGCNEKGCSGGNAWRDTGYWTVCYKHADEHRKGKLQPKMKQKSIDRETSRDKVTGCLPNVSKNSG